MSSTAASTLAGVTRSAPGIADGSWLVEALQRDVRDRAAHPRVDRLVDPARAEVPLDEPGGGAARHPLEIGDPERLAAREQRQRARMADGRRPRERAARAAELALPPVRVRERVGLAGIVGGEAGERAQPLALGRRRLDRPREPRERAPRRVAAHVVGVEELAHRLPERARLAR